MGRPLLYDVTIFLLYRDFAVDDHPSASFTDFTASEQVVEMVESRANRHQNSWQLVTVIF